MYAFRIAAASPRWMIVGVCLAVFGCDNTPPVPPEVEAIARERKAAEQRALDEAAQRRAQRRPAIAPTDLIGESSAGDSRPLGTEDGGDPNAQATDVVPRSDENAAAKIDASAVELPPRPTPPPPTSPPPPRNHTAALKWAQIRAGLPMTTVQQLLGTPTRIADDDFFLTYWYYGEGRDAGKVAFLRATQRTMAWDPPLH